MASSLKSRTKVLTVIGLYLIGIHSVLAQDGDSLRTQFLSEVVIEASATEGDTLQNFYRSNMSSTTENILSRMQGVTLIRRGAYGQEPLFRGMSNGQLNVTIDGMKVFGACTDKMDPVTIYVEPWNLSSIQTLPGSQGSQFGSTVGGSLNMKLAQPIVGKPGVDGKAGVDYHSSASAINYFSVLNLSRTASAYRATITYRNSNNYHAGGGQEIQFSQYEKINLAAAGKWTLAKLDTLQADILFDQGWNIGFPALPMDVGDATSGIYSLTYRRVAPWHFFHNITAKAYHNRITHSMDDTHRKDVVIHMDMPGKSETTGIFVEGDVHVFHEHKTTLKIDYFTNSSLAEMVMYPEEGSSMYMQTGPKARRQNAGFFLNQHFRFNRNNKVLFSFRADVVNDHLADGIGKDQWEIFDPSIHKNTTNFLKTFSVNHIHNLTNSIMLEFKGGYGERMPTLNERYGFYLFNRFDSYDYLGNPELKNEQSWNAEASLNFLSSKVEIQLAPFFQQIDNYITGQVSRDYSTMTAGAKGVKQYVNRERAYLSGFDFMIMANPIPAMQWITTVKYTYGTFSGNEALPLIPPLKSVTSLRYELKKWNIQGEWELSTAQKHVSHTYGEQPTAGYSIVSLRTGYRLNTTWQLNGGVENMFDSYYREHLDWGGIPRPGRNIYLNVIYKFSKK